MEEKELHETGLSLGSKYLLKTINAQRPLVLQQRRELAAMLSSESFEDLWNTISLQDSRLENGICKKSPCVAVWS